MRMWHLVAFARVELNVQPFPLLDPAAKPLPSGARMTFVSWIAMVGGLLLVMALSSALLRRLPVSTAAIYLAIGCVIGPWGFDLVRLDLSHGNASFEHLTEGAVILSLFIGGLRLRLPWTDTTWRAAGRLAGPVMIVSIAGVAAVGYFALHLEPALALLLGAVLAPTDPVLAGAVKVNHSQDHDRVRYALSGEAGLNDGAAFPFVVLGLGLLASPYDAGEFGSWALQRIVWAIPAGLLLGFALGKLVGRGAIALRSHQRDTAAPTDFLALALVALSYSAAEAIHAWGFLAVFAAGLGLRRAEVSVVMETPHPEAPDNRDEEHPPAETLVAPNVVTEEEMSEPAVAAGVLVAEVFSFGDTVERLLEVLLVVLVGVSLAAHWDWRAVPVAAVLFIVIRPLASMALLIGTPTSYLQRGLLGWFGIRGIGSLYYLAYSLNHGLEGAPSRELADLTLSVIALSVITHGLSARPLLKRYESALARQRQ